LLGIEVASGGYFGGGPDECRAIAEKATTPKAAIMTTLAAIVAAWEGSTAGTCGAIPPHGTPACSALIEWGYQPSEVERLLLGEESTGASDTSTDADNAA